MSAPATQQPIVPPRPSKSPAPAKELIAAAVAGGTIPTVPPRPIDKRIDRSKSPNPERFAQSPFSGGLIKSPNTAQFPSNNITSDSSDPIERSRSVPMPSVGEEGLEYTAVTKELNDEQAEVSSPEQTRTVDKDLKLHAPRPSLPAESAKQRVQNVTRTDSDKAASYGIGKPGFLDERSTSRNALKKKPSSSFSQTSETGHHTDDEHGIPEFGQRVPMNPYLGDVQAPSPAPVEANGKNHNRRHSARALPPGSYGMHGHGVVPQDELQKAYYKKHPEVLEREHQTPLHDRQNDFAMSSNELNRLVRDTASRGSTKGAVEHTGTPHDEVAFQASEEYATRMATPRPVSIASKDGGAPLEDPGSAQVDEKPIHVDDPHHPELYSSGVEQAPEDGDHQEYNAPILAIDEIQKDTAHRVMQPAVRPQLERNDSSYDGSRPTSRPSSRPSSIYNSYPSIEFNNTPLEDVREYEPLFPEETSKKGEEKSKTPEECKARHQFPSKDIWEDAPTSVHYTAEVSTPDNAEDDQRRRKSSSHQGQRPITPAHAFAQQFEELAEKEANGKKNTFLPIFEQKPPTWVDHQPHLKGERPAINRRFPSKDIWEDTPESLLHEAELNESPKGEEQEVESPPKEEEKQAEKPEVPARPVKASTDSLAQPPPIPQRPKSRQSGSSKEEVATKELPSAADASSKPPVPSRPVKKISGDSKDGELSKPKPPVPSRPVGGKIAALKAGFLSDLNKRLQLGPQGPQKEETEAEAPVEEKEKAPLVDARKGRARGPQRRAPTKADAPAPASTSSKEPAVLSFSLPQTIWNIHPEDDIVVVASASVDVTAKEPLVVEPELKQAPSEVAKTLEPEEAPKVEPKEVSVPELHAKAEEPAEPKEPRASEAVVIPESSKDIAEVNVPEESKEDEKAKEPGDVKEETLVSNTAGESILEAKVEQKEDSTEIEPVEVKDEVKA